MTTAISVDNRATLPIAQNLSLGRLIYDDGGRGLYRISVGANESVIVDEFDVVPDFGFSSAVYDGLSPGTPRRDQAVSFECTTRNCTWPVITSAALCSRCNDVSSQLVTIKGKSSAPQCTDQFVPNNAGLVGPCTNYTLPYGHIKQFDQPRAPDPNDTGGSAVYPTVLLTANVSTHYPATISFKNLDTMLIAFLILRGSNDFLYNNVSWGQTAPLATECALYFCANSYKSSVVDGVLKEEKTGSWAVREPRSWKTADYAPHKGYPNGTNGPEYQAWDEQYPSLSQRLIERVFRTDLQLRIPAEESGQLGANVARTFNVTQTTITGIQSFMLGLSFGAVNASIAPEDQRVMVYPIKREINPLADVFWRSTNLSSTFENLASRLTVQLRGSSNLTQQGTSEEYVIHFEVNWPFVAVPLSTLLVGCIYFLVIMCQTRRLKLPVWKESAYPTLMYGFDDSTQSLLRGADKTLDGPKAVKRFREGVFVRLMDSDQGLRLHMRNDPAKTGMI